MLSIDKKIFSENLLLTQAYCEEQLVHTDKNYAAILRSFNPVYNGSELFSFTLCDYGTKEDPTYCFLSKWTTDPFSQKDFLLDLFNAQAKHKSSRSASKYLNLQIQGAILITEVDNTVVDGASAVQSGGLIDDFDCPPIDTWFYMTGSRAGQLLFAWIPQPFVKSAGEGIAVNCMDCINWFKDLYPDEYKFVMEPDTDTAKTL